MDDHSVDRVTAPPQRPGQVAAAERAPVHDALAGVATSGGDGLARQPAGAVSAGEPLSDEDVIDLGYLPTPSGWRPLDRIGGR